MQGKTPTTTDEQDKAYNPGELRANERFAGNHDNIPNYNRSSDGLDDHPISAGVADGKQPDPNKHISEADQLESNPPQNRFDYPETGNQRPDNRNLWQRIRGSSRNKKSATAALITTITIGGFGMFSLPTFLPFAITSNLTNHNDSSARTNPSRFVAYAKGLFGSNNLACAGGAGIRCKLGSASPKQVQALRDAGFKVDGKTNSNGRMSQLKVTAKDGTSIKNGSGFEKYLKNNPTVARDLERANPTKVASYKSPFSKWLTARGYTRGPTAKPTGKSIKEKFASLRKSTNVASVKSPTAIEKIKARLNKTTAKAGKAAALTGGGCLAYNSARAVTAGVKAQHLLAYLGMFMMIAKVADEARSPDGIDPETMTVAMAALTTPALSGPGKGLTALDSQGMKSVLHGGERVRSTWTQRILLGNNRSLIAVDNTIVSLNKEIGKNNIQATCKKATSLKYAATLIAATCAIQTGTAAAAGSVVPGAGTATAAAGAMARCLGAAVVKVAVFSFIVGKMVSKAVGWATDALSDSDLDEVENGPVFGDGVAVGASIATEGANLGSGAHVATSSDQITAFNNSTQQYIDTNNAIAKEDARDDPFNVYNPDSFLGSIATSPAFVDLQANPGPQAFIASILKLSLSFTPTSTASALGTKTSIKPGDYTKENCEDEGFIESGAVCNIVGRPYFVMSPKALNMSSETAVNYMISGGYIDENDETGAPKSDTAYEKWVQYCTDEREEFVGLTSVPVESDDYPWSTGKKCDPKNNKAVDYFAGFRSLNNVVDSVDDDEDGQVPDAATSTDTTIIDGPSKDGWVWPVPDVHQLGTLKYGGSGSKGVHKGIDIGVRGGTLGKTVVAAHDGTVDRVWGQGDACGAYVSIKAGDTGYYAAYQHLDGASIKVKAGDTVKAGQPIAQVGRQGGSTCGSAGFYHLHFSIESKPGMVSAYANPFPNGTVDPLGVLPK